MHAFLEASNRPLYSDQARELAAALLAVAGEDDALASVRSNSV
jgi:hypothetical protein